MAEATTSGGGNGANDDPSLRTGGGYVGWLFVLGYGLTILLLYLLITWGGVWDWLAQTRILRWLFEAGIVALTDADQGFFPGIPDPEYFRQAYDPVSWLIVGLGIGSFLCYMLFKMLQFHIIALVCGSRGTLGQHARAYTYGEGMGRLLPFNFGTTATVSALVGQGMRPVQARYAVYVADLFFIFEILFFAIVVILLLGVVTSINAFFWPFIILVVCLFLTTGLRLSTNSKKANAVAVVQVLQHLSAKPFVLISLAVLSIGAFLLLEIGAYLLLSAYTGTFVLIAVEHEILMMGLVAGSIARLVPITPGGTGQFEWGMAVALYLTGVGIQEAMVIPLIYNGYRYLIHLVALASVSFGFGIETSFRRVFDVFRGVSLAMPQTA